MNKRICLLFPLLLLLIVTPAIGQDEEVANNAPQLWTGLELAHWIRNGGGDTYIVPEGAFRYRLGKYGGLSLFTGYHVVKRDSLFSNIAYSSRGGYVKAGPDVYLSLSEDDDIFFVLGGHFAYSRFTEEAIVSIAYDPEEFEAEIDPDNIFQFRGRDCSQAWALGLRQGILFTDDRFSFLMSAHIDFLLNTPENNLMPVHHIPGIGIRTPQYYFLNKNDETISKDTFVSLRLHLFYKLF